MAAAVLTWLAGVTPGSALGKPDWAKPYLETPTPSGDFIAKNDLWAVVWCEIQLGLTPAKLLVARHRLVLENLSGSAEAFHLVLAHDAGRETLEGLSLNVQRTVWHEINLERNSVRGTTGQGERVLLASAERIEPHKRVALEFTLTDRLGLVPWKAVALFRSEPVARLEVRVEPSAAARGLTLELVNPSGRELPASVRVEGEGLVSAERVPASERLTTRNLLYQPADSDLFPFAVAWVKGSAADSYSSFARSYRKVWLERLGEIDKAQVAALAATLTSGVTAAWDKAQRLADYVQHEILYDSSNEASIDAWVPTATQETLRAKKADCKGKVMLLQALLGAAGVESTPVLMRFDSAYFTWGERPPLASFNHVVLAVKIADGEKALGATLVDGAAAGCVLIDPTVTTASFGASLPGHEGMPALLIAEVADPVFAIKTTMPSMATTDVEAECALGANGSLSGELRVVDNGLGSIAALLASPITAQELRTQLDELLRRQFPQGRIREHELTPAVRGVAATRLRLAFEASGCLQELSSSVLLQSPLALIAELAGLPPGLQPGVPMKPDDAVVLREPWDARRNASGRATKVTASIDLRLPAGLEWEPPPGRKEERPWLRYELKWTRTGERAFRGELRFEVPRGNWDPVERKARLRAMDEVLTGLRPPLLLRRTPASPQDRS